MGKHRDYEPFESGEHMEEDLGMFEAAIKHPRMDLEIRPIGKILILSQAPEVDSNLCKLASEIARRTGAATSEQTAVGSLEAIQSHLSQRDLGLLVVQVPFGIEVVSDPSHSLGAVVDELLQACPVPILCQPRNPNQVDWSDPFNLNHLLIALTRDDQAALESVAWAFRLASKESRINVLEFADRSAIQEARQLLGGQEEIQSIEEAAINRAVTSRLGGIIGAAQSLAHARGLPLHIDFRLGKPAKEIANLADQLSCGLIITSRPADHTSAAYLLIKDLLLTTRRAVLVV